MAVEQQLWGSETSKAIDNFPVSGERVPTAVVRMLGHVKAAAARVNGELGLLDGPVAERIAAAGDEVARGEHDGQFPIDVFPSAVHLAAVAETTAKLLPALEKLAGAFEVKADAWRDVVKAGRTHMMDAVPVTLGQEFAGYA